MRRFGVHAANKYPYHDELLDGMGCTTLLISDDNDKERARAIRSDNPNMTIILRPYFASNMTCPPEARASLCFSRVANLLETTTTHVTLGNEFNVETPGFDQYSGGSWIRLAEYKLKLYTRFRELAPNCDLHLCAESWMQGDDAPPGVLPGLAHQRETAKLCDYVDAHAYWAPGQQLQDAGGLRFKRIRDIFPDTPMFLTECGPLDIRRPEVEGEIKQWLAEVYKYPWLCGLSLFQMNWGIEHPEFNYYNFPGMLDRLKAEPEVQALAKIPLGPMMRNMKDWIVTTPFGFRSPIYTGGVHNGTDFALPEGTEGSRFISPWGWGRVDPDITAWRADRGWYGYWRLDGPLAPRLSDSVIELFACHLQQEPHDLPIEGHLGYVGNTGNLTTGAHIHLGLCESEPMPPYAVRRWIDIMGPEVERGW